jgi:hypothetical protein
MRQGDADLRCSDVRLTSDFSSATRNRFFCRAEMLRLRNSVAVNYAGNPALAVPILLRRGNVRVTTLQLIGPRALLAAGRLLEARR